MSAQEKHTHTHHTRARAQRRGEGERASLGRLGAGSSAFLCLDLTGVLRLRSLADAERVVVVGVKTGM